MPLEVTYAFIGFIMGGVAILISLYVWLTLDQVLKNGQHWIQLNKELQKKIDKLTKDGRVDPWKK